MVYGIQFSDNNFSVATEQLIKVESGKENNVISGNTLVAKDIVDISKFNFIQRLELQQE